MEKSQRAAGGMSFTCFVQRASTSKVKVILLTQMEKGLSVKRDKSQIFQHTALC